MRRFIFAAALAAIALLSACSTEPSAPTAQEQACETFKAVTPGFFESDWAAETLQDSAATSTDRVEAMKTMLDIRAGKGRTEPYTCDEPAFDRYLTEQGIE
ncbi:hypothetical protein HQO42_15065 [Rhodococcus fascians]|nr:hypothetical protein [Rhodococcus fascians]MBY4237775.1 hypothetical protein [Rhodococcus fascians]MBY4253978.1 hypothetical protein [Rhodococcus fascians]MBY4269151.1 hypothetical protein [Rhodococcus fascians]